MMKGTVALAGVAALGGMAMAEVNQPQEIIDRPLTTPASQVNLEADLGITFTDPSYTGMTLNAGYGINDKFDVGVGYGFAIDPSEAKGDLAFGAGYSLIGEENFAVAARVNAGYNFLAEGVDPLGLGAEVRFKLSKQLAIYAPAPQLVITLDPIDDGLGNEYSPIYITLPVAVGFQAAPQLFVYANTTIADIEIKDSTTGVWGADFIPLTVGGFFSPSNAIDVGAAVSFIDLSHESGQDVNLILTGRVAL
jgi:hypothetical protein